ncbi:hypothetical protein Misp01_71060 [Microtetraspora sp. NBRC 13810]|uniref:hypothetical protein n=1 Tax=Microtetraspora sp. NBRC 13810 TaxID=3030990 RepID=UPI0024A4BD55|nr:hypothetical protein [Microtetraspora sp. NBRC 13810]GLW11978.1 hypothetical protein Misp01_71060 [Microtetraspora sp. NBRC 13810]
MTAPVTDQVTPAANDVSHASDLRIAARWLVAASASVAAALVAGVQLRNFADLGDVGQWAVAVGLLAILTALASVVWTLYSAAAVLTVRRRSIGELAELDRLDNGNFPDHRLEAPRSALVSHLVVERRTNLLGMSRDAIWQLSRDHAIAHQASTLPQTTEMVRIGTHVYDPRDPLDNTALANLALDLDRRVQCVVDAAASFETQQRYHRLTRRMKLLGIPFVASVLILLWLQTLTPKLMNVKTPISVHIVTPRSGQDPCAGKVLEGVAVGGTMDAPIVVLHAQAGCSARKLTDTQEFIVIPRIGK